jgi:hypothetical protein
MTMITQTEPALHNVMLGDIEAAVKGLLAKQLLAERMRSLPNEIEREV